MPDIPAQIHDATPLVSIIIPTYNGVQFLAETLDSVFSQDYPSYEVIVVNDGSTDETARVIEPYMDDIRYAYQENQGTAAARNHGLKLARGDFLVFLDHDDLLLPHALTDRINGFKAHPSAGMINSGRHLINEEGAFINPEEPWHHVPRLELEDWVRWAPVFPSAMMFRREWIERSGGFDLSLSGADDLAMVWRLALMGCQAAWVKKNTICYRVHTGNQSRHGTEFARVGVKMRTQFFAQSDLPKRIRRLESHSQYYNLIWHSWNLMSSGHQDAVPLFLQESLNYASAPRIITLLSWTKEFMHWSLHMNAPLSELHTALPFFRAAMNIEEAQWRTLEPLLRIWISFWCVYWHGDTLHDDTHNLAAVVQGFTLHRIVETLQTLTIVSGEFYEVHKITAFWSYLRKIGLVAPSQQYEVTVLYLTIFGRALLKKQWHIALDSLGAVMKLSWHPRAIMAWGRFVWYAVRYKHLTKNFWSLNK